MSANDPFGLTPNNAAADRNVVPIDSIQAVTVSTSPFDSRLSGFTGAAVNATTKSGTNEFSGSVYYIYRDQRLVRKNLETHTGNIIEVPDFKEKTMGFTLGGPIIENRLFFFLAYERVREDNNPPALNAAGPQALYAPGEFARITAQAANLGFQVGEEVEPQNRLEDDNILIKLDWEINQNHRLSVRYNDVESARPVFSGYGGNNFSFDSHWYSQEIENTSYIAQLFSTWTDDFSTEVAVSYSEYFSAPVFDRRSPSVAIFNVPLAASTQTGAVRFGTERSRHFNRLEVDTWTVEIYGTYDLNDRNTLSFGYQMNRADVFNAFVQDFLGTYEFDSVEAFEAASAGGWIGRYRFQFENPGINPAAEFRETNHGLFVQNAYRPNEALSIIYGARVDIPRFGDDPPANPLFEETFGFRSNHTYSGNAVIQPRVGFNLRVNDEGTQQIRGGFGLFYGQMPRVWMSNSYSNTGSNFSSIDIINNTLQPGDSGYQAGRDPSINPTPAPSPDPDNQPRLTPDAAAQQVNSMDPDFELPSRWKGTLALRSAHQQPRLLCRR